MTTAVYHGYIIDMNSIYKGCIIGFNTWAYDMTYSNRCRNGKGMKPDNNGNIIRVECVIMRYDQQSTILVISWGYEWNILDIAGLQLQWYSFSG